MTVAILVSGSIFKEPQQRTSQSGKRYVVATIKAAAADNASSDFWSALAFGTTAGDELMRLAVGERVAIQGGLKLETYTANDGTTKISKTIFVDHVLAVRQPPREKKPKAAKAAPTSTSQGLAKQSVIPPSSESPTERAPSSFYSDDIPF
jgi:single-stranded DNA-binding protein